MAFRKFIHPKKGIKSFDVSEKTAREYGWSLYEEPKPVQPVKAVEPKIEPKIEAPKKKRKPRTKK